MTFRQSTTADLQQIWQIIIDAKRIMQESGRHQWTDEYPSHERIEADIMSGDAYVACDGDGHIAAYAYITAQPEPAYDSPDVHWHYNGPYMVIHRLAVSALSRGCGLGRMMLLHAEKVCCDHGIGCIKVDTNHDNAEMLYLLDSLGYARRGNVSYGPRGERIAFEKTL